MSVGVRSYSSFLKPWSPCSSSPWSDSRQSPVQVYHTYCVSLSTYSMCFNVFLWLGCLPLVSAPSPESLLSVVSLNLLFFPSHNRHDVRRTQRFTVVLLSKSNDTFLLEPCFLPFLSSCEELLHGLSLVRLICQHSSKKRLFCGILVINTLYVVRSVF